MFLMGREGNSPSYWAMLLCLPTFEKEVWHKYQNVYAILVQTQFFFLITCAHSYDQSSMPPGTQTWGFWRWLVAIMINSSFSAHMFFLFLRHRVLITKFCSFTTASAQLATASTLLQSPYQSAVWNDIFRQWEGHGDNPVALWIQIW